MTAHILVVEDEVKLARFSELELSSEGYKLNVAHDGIAGLTLARDSSPDLAILDSMLPGLTGLEICRCLQRSIELTAKEYTRRDTACSLHLAI